MHLKKGELFAIIAPDALPGANAKSPVVPVLPCPDAVRPPVLEKVPVYPPTPATEVVALPLSLKSHLAIIVAA